MLGFFNGLGKTPFVMIQGLLSAFAVRIPLSYVFRYLPDTNMLMIGIAVPVSAAASLLLCIVYYFIVNRKMRSQFNDVTEQFDATNGDDNNDKNDDMTKI